MAAELMRLTLAGAAACAAMARFVADDVLRAALLGVARERVALDTAVTLLASVTWDRAEAPGTMWVIGAHVSSRAPALAAVLLGDVESEDGAEGGVALSPSAVGAVVQGMASALSRPSGSGSFLWSVIVSRKGVHAASARRERRGRHAALIAAASDRAGRSCTRSRVSPSATKRALLESATDTRDRAYSRGLRSHQRG